LRKGFLGKEKSLLERRGAWRSWVWGEELIRWGSSAGSGSKVDGRGLGAGAEGEG
jgi:hypothetical protein